MHKRLTPTPPMGWNSWNCYGASVREDEVRQNADYMAKYLKEYGWQYIIVDIQWSEPNAKSNEYNEGAPLCMDEWGRLIPAPNRFPSSKDGAGFLPLSDYVHSLGLKFGIHIMRGIPKQAVRKNTPVLGTQKRAEDIADTSSVCEWNTDMYGLDSEKEGAQAYYDSIMALYASWGVDYIKADDMSRPYHADEAEMLRRAIDKTGRDIVLSLSPGAAPLSGFEHLASVANLWRMTDDFWDTWKQLREAFDYCRNWQNLKTAGAWPDCDMLTVGKIGIRSNGGARMTNFTIDEQKTHMALWCMFRSPMFIGCEMTENDDFTYSLLTNRELIKILNDSRENRELYRDERGAIVWYAENDEAKYLAQFNVSGTELKIATPLSLIGLEKADFTELFDGSAGAAKGHLTSKVAPHGVKIYKLIQEEKR